MCNKKTCTKLSLFDSFMHVFSQRCGKTVYTLPTRTRAKSRDEKYRFAMAPNSATVIRLMRCSTLS